MNVDNNARAMRGQARVRAKAKNRQGQDIMGGWDEMGWDRMGWDGI